MQKLYFRLFVFIAILLFSYNAYSQVSAKVSYLMPRANYGKVFNSGTSIELEYFLWDYEKRFSSSFSIGVNFLRMRSDTILSYGLTDIDGLKVLPGYEIYKDYRSFPLAINNEFRILNTKVSPFVGLDCYIHFISYEHISDIATLSNTEESIGKVAIGFQPRIGIQFDNKKGLVLSSGIGKVMSREQEYINQSYWKVYLATRYFFNSKRK